MKSKQEIRQDIKILFQKADKKELFSKDKIINETIVSFIQKHGFKSVALYESMSDEVDTKGLIKKLINQKIIVLLPHITSETEMIFKSIQGKVTEVDLLIIPGRAFSKSGKRLGRGKGYYDRFLSNEKFRAIKKVGICYDFQIMKEIPTDIHDIDMDHIISN